MTSLFPGRALLRAAVLSLVLAPLAWSPTAAQAPAADFLRVDAHALAAPAEQEASVESLAAYLAAGADTEREKARAIFRWMTANVRYDAEAFLAGSASWVDGSEVLSRRVAVCDGYATLFVELAGAMGLRAELVRGYVKGFGFDGQRFRQPNHAWNAVEIDGEWHLLDATWGAGVMRGTTWQREFSEHFFLTPPEELIYTHLPSDRRWQLVANRRTMRAFLQQPEIPFDLVSLGFSGVQIEGAVRSGVRELATAYRHPERPIRIEEAPLGRAVAAGHEKSFRVHAPEASAVQITDGSTWHRLTDASDAGLWQGSVALAPGRWMVYAEFPDEDPHVFLEYSVQ